MYLETGYFLAMTVINLQSFEKKVFSQNGEDGVIAGVPCFH
jgi:hypothetical protein